LIDALVDGVAVCVHSVFGASGTFRDYGLSFVGNETINGVVRISLEVETAGL
jgi:hypothetical protein